MRGSTGHCGRTRVEIHEVHEIHHGLVALIAVQDSTVDRDGRVTVTRGAKQLLPEVHSATIGCLCQDRFPPKISIQARAIAPSIIHCADRDINLHRDVESISTIVQVKAGGKAKCQIMTINFSRDE